MPMLTRTAFSISGEMTAGIFKKRKRREDAFFNPDNKVCDNITFKHAKGRSISNPDDQRYFDRCIELAGTCHPAGTIDLIVFDNWQCLCQEAASSRSSMATFMDWVGKWQERGVCVILVTHTTKDGVILGSGKLSDSADMSIRLYRASEDDTISILVSPKDVRDGKRSLFLPFIVSYDFDHGTSDWEIFEPDPEWVKALIEWNKNGCEGKILVEP